MRRRGAEALRRLGARAVRNSREVLLTYPGLRMGNVLYFALHSHVLQRAGVDHRVVDPDPGASWTESFPELRQFLVEPAAVRRTDRRRHIPDHFLQAFGTDFTGPEMSAFIEDVLLNGPFADLVDATHTVRNDTLTINVRRGDYYANPQFRLAFGFDVAAYVRAALEDVELRTGTVDRVHVVSDDPAWCRANLGWLASSRRRATWSSSTDGPTRNLADLAASRRLILSNSTFSYWGAYLSQVVRRDDHRGVWAPALHSRLVDDGRPWQHAPTWRVIPVD